jgi:hypothetical protein
VPKSGGRWLLNGNAGTGCARKSEILTGCPVQILSRSGRAKVGANVAWTHPAKPRGYDECPGWGMKRHREYGSDTPEALVSSSSIDFAR